MALPRSALCLGSVMLMLVACGTPPGLEAGAPLISADQPLDLLPLDDLIAQAGSGTVQQTDAAALAARAARLRAGTGATGTGG